MKRLDSGIQICKRRSPLDDGLTSLVGGAHTYLKEEIEEEGAVRNLGTFVRFLKVAALQSGQQLNY